MIGPDLALDCFSGTIGIASPFSLPREATPSLNRKRIPWPEHSRPFFTHFWHFGSASSQRIRRLLQL
jgi:hypothetical protein